MMKSRTLRPSKDPFHLNPGRTTIPVMHEQVDKTNDSHGALTPLQIFHDGFDEWVLWLRSIVRDCEKPAPGHRSHRAADTVTESKRAVLATDRERDEDARWVDDGGVSLVVSEETHCG
jgi:hypothetical protein